MQATLDFQLSWAISRTHPAVINKWKNTRKSETSLRETSEYDHISDEEIDSDDAQVTSGEEDEEDIPDLDDDWLLFNKNGQNRSSMTIKENVAIVLGYSVCHNCTGEAI